MAQTTQIRVSSGLTFTAEVAGQKGSPLALLLHGFPESRHTWRYALPKLAAAGYYAVAPDQRGYSAGARPDPTDLSNYTYEKLISDALDIVAAVGYQNKKFHLVAHDWGGHIAWGLANYHPDRIASLTVLSRPHPSAFKNAVLNPNSDQKHRSRHHQAFLSPSTGPNLLADNFKGLRDLFAGAGVSKSSADLNLQVLGSLPAIESALAWYRANTLASNLGHITVPTLYIWGDKDATVSAEAARGTKDFVKGEFRFVALEGVGHFVMDDAAERATELMIEHFGRNSVDGGRL